MEALAMADALGDGGGGEDGGEGHHAAGDGLAHAHDVGLDAGVFPGEEFTGAAEAGGDLVEDKEDAGGVAGGAEGAEVGGVIETHAAGALDDGFEDDGGKGVAVLLDEGGHGREVGGVPGFVEVVDEGGGGGEEATGEGGAEERMHAGDGVADAHGVPGVAVVAGADGEEVGLGGVVLDGHLEGDLDGDGAAVGVEDFVHRGGRDAQETLGEVDGGLVGEAAEHHVAHLGGLLLRGLDQDGVGIAVDGAPPTTHALDQAAAVGQDELATLGAVDLVGGLGRDGGGVGMPEMVTVEGFKENVVHDWRSLLRRATRAGRLSATSILTGRELAKTVP